MVVLVTLITYTSLHAAAPSHNKEQRFVTYICPSHMLDHHISSTFIKVNYSDPEVNLIHSKYILEPPSNLSIIYQATITRIQGVPKSLARTWGKAVQCLEF